MQHEQAWFIGTPMQHSIDEVRLAHRVVHRVDKGQLLRLASRLDRNGNEKDDRILAHRGLLPRGLYRLTSPPSGSLRKAMVPELRNVAAVPNVSSMNCMYVTLPLLTLARIENGDVTTLPKVTDR